MKNDKVLGNFSVGAESRMDALAGVTCNTKGSPKGPLSNIEDGLEQSVSEQTKERIGTLLERIESLSDVEKLLLYLKLPTGSASEDVLRQTPTSCLYASNRLEQAQAFTWIRSHLEEDSQICVPKHEVYDDYRLYCDSHRLKPLCPADFGKVLKCIFPNVKPRRLGQRGQSRYCYSGLRKKLDVQPPSLPDLEVSPKKPKREELQESEMMSASCQLVCEWAGRLLSRTFGGVGELAEFLVGNLYVNSKSTAAFTVLAALQDTAVNNSSGGGGGGGGVCPLLSSSSGGDRHRETQLQLQRKLQERELIKEQKKKLQQQRNEIQQQQQQQLLLLRGTTTTPTTPTPTPSPQPRAFSKTPTPLLRSPVGGRPPSSCLKSPTPTLSFRASGKGPTARNITRLLQSPLPKPSPHPFLPAKVENPASHPHPHPHLHLPAGERTTPATGQETGEAGESKSGVKSSNEATAWYPLHTNPNPAASTTTNTTTTAATAAAFHLARHRLQKPVVLPRTENNQPLASVASCRDGSSQVTMTTSSVVSSLSGRVLETSSAANVLEKVAASHSMAVGHFSSISDGAPFSSHNAAVSRNTHLLTGVDSVAANSSSSQRGVAGGGREIAGKQVSSAWASVVSSQAAHTLTFVSGAESSSSSEQSSVDMDSIVPTSDPALLPGNMSARSAFVPVTNQKQSFALMAPSTSATAASESCSSSSDEMKDMDDASSFLEHQSCVAAGGGDVVAPPADQAELSALQQRQLSDSLSGGFQPHAETRSESGASWNSSGMASRADNSQSASQGGGRKGKNRFTPIRPKAPQPLPPSGKDDLKDRERCRPVSALLKEKRAREAQEVLQHLASSFHQQHTASAAAASASATSSASSTLPSTTLTLPAEVLGLSGERGPGGGNEVVIILTSPSSSAAQRAGANPSRLPPSEEKGWRAGCVARSMSDILIANPNFPQQKAAPPPTTTTTTSTSTPSITTSNNTTTTTAAAMVGGKVRTMVTSELSSGVVPASGVSAHDSSEIWEAGNSAADDDEEVTRHMTNAATHRDACSAHARLGARTPGGGQTPTRQMSHTPTLPQQRSAKTPTLTFRSTPTPTPTPTVAMQVAGSRKRKLESIGEATPFVKRSSISLAQDVFLPNFLESAHSSVLDDPDDVSMLLDSECKNSAQDAAARAEDDDVFILDLPSSMPEPKPQGQGHQWVRPEVVGRAVRRSEVVSPYPRPHSSTPLHVQMDQPISWGLAAAGPSEAVSRCQSTGIELNEVMTRCLSTGLPGEDRPQKARASQPEDPASHMAGKLNLESMESDALLDSEAPPPSQMPLMLPGTSSRGMGEELAAAQRALLREKQLLDARFHSFWTRLRSMDAATPTLGLAGSGQGGVGMTGGVSASTQEELGSDIFSTPPSYSAITSSAVNFALETASQSSGHMAAGLTPKPDPGGFPSSGADALMFQSSGANLCQASTSAEEQLNSVHLYPSDHSPQQVQSYPRSPFLMSPASGQLLADSLLVQSHPSGSLVHVHSDTSVGLNSAVMSTAGGEEEKDMMTAYAADERLSLDGFSVPSGPLRGSEVSGDPGSMMMEDSGFSMDPSAFGMDTSSLSVDPNSLSSMLSVDTNPLGLDSHPLAFDAGSLGMETNALGLDSNPVDSDTLSMAADHFVQLVQGLVSSQDASPPHSSQLLHPVHNLPTQVSSTLPPFQGLAVVSSSSAPQPLQGPMYPSPSPSSSSSSSQTLPTCLASSVSMPLQKLSSSFGFSSVSAINALRHSKGSGLGVNTAATTTTTTTTTTHALPRGLLSQAFLPQSARSRSASSETPPQPGSEAPPPPPPPPPHNAPQSKAVKREAALSNSRSKSEAPPPSSSKGRGSQSGGGTVSQSKGRSNQAPPPNTLLALLKSPVLSAISATSAGAATSAASRVWASSKAPPPPLPSSVPPTTPSSLTPIPTPTPTTTIITSTQEASIMLTASSRPSFSAATSAGLFVTPAVSNVAVSSVVEKKHPTTVVASHAPIVSPMPVTQFRMQTTPRGGSSVVLQPSGSNPASLHATATTTATTSTTSPALVLSSVKEHAEESVCGELPLDVADFVTEHRLKVELQQQLQQHKHQLLLQHQQQQQQQQKHQHQHGMVSSREGKDISAHSATTLLTEKELTALLLSHGGGGGGTTVLTPQEGESIKLAAAAARTHSAPLLQWSATGGDPKTSLGMMTSTALTVTLTDQKNTFPVPSSPAPKQRLSESGLMGLKKQALLQRSASLPLSGASPTAELSSLLTPVPTSSPSHDPATLTSRRGQGSGGVNGAVSRLSSSSRDHVTSPVCVSVVSPGEGGGGGGGVSSVSAFVPIQGSPLSRGVGSRPLRPALTVPLAGGHHHHRVVQTSTPLTLVNIDQLTVSAPLEATHNDPSPVTRPLTSSPRPGTVAYSAPSSSHPAVGVSPGPSPTPPSSSSQAYSPSPTPASQRGGMGGGGGQGVLQQLLSARGAPPSYAQTLQQRLLSSAMFSNSPIIRGAAQVVAGSAQTVGKLMDTTTTTTTTPTHHAATAQRVGGLESSVLVSVASILAEDVKPVAKALVHHIPCPSPSPPYKDASPAGSVGSLDRSPAPSRSERSPASSSIDRSPASAYKDRSPASSSYKDRSPASSSYKDRSPASSSYKDRSPISSHKDRSPAPSSRSERSPASSSGAKDRSPAYLGGKDRSPAASHGERSPASSSEKTVGEKTPQKERGGRRSSAQRRESAGSRSRLPSGSKLPAVASPDARAASRNTASNPSSPTDANDYSRPFSHKLKLLKQHVLGDRGQVGVTLGGVLQGGGAVSEVPSSPAALSPSGRGVGGGSLSVAVSSPATPGSLSSSAPSPASQGQGQGQGSVPTPGSGVAVDVFFSVPPASPAPSPRVLHAFSPQQLSSSSSSGGGGGGGGSSNNTQASTLFLPFNLPDMNYMGNAPNIDLSQLLPAKTSPSSSSSSSSSSSLAPPSSSSVLVSDSGGGGGGGLHSVEDRCGGGEGGVRGLEEHGVSSSSGGGVGGGMVEERNILGRVVCEEDVSVTGSGGQGRMGVGVGVGVVSSGGGEGGGVLSGGELQTLDELQSTLEILQGMDSHYFSSSEFQGHDLLHNVLGHLTSSDFQSPSNPCLEEEGGEEEERGGRGRKMDC